jgi:hypothetical protein
MKGAEGGREGGSKHRVVNKDDSWIVDETDAVLRGLVDELAEEEGERGAEGGGRRADGAGKRGAEAPVEMQQQSALIQR